MEANDRSIQIPEFTDKKMSKKRQKTTKPLFKMKIGDLQSLEHDPDTDSFKFKNHSLSLVVCGGKITDIFRDDNILFSFEMDDGSGTISCFHKFKYNREELLENLCKLPTSAQFLQTSFCPNQTRTTDETVFNATNDNTVIQHLENDASNAFGEIMTWFREEFVEKPKSRKIGDFIHVMGHLMYGDGIRKINVLRFNMATNEERKDLEQEIYYLNQCVY